MKKALRVLDWIGRFQVIASLPVWGKSLLLMLVTALAWAAAFFSRLDIGLRIVIFMLVAVLGLVGTGWIIDFRRRLSSGASVVVSELSDVYGRQDFSAKLQGPTRANIWVQLSLLVGLTIILVAIFIGGDPSGHEPTEPTGARQGAGTILLIWDPSSSSSAHESTIHGTLRTVEGSLIDRLSSDWSLHLFTVSHFSLHQLPLEVGPPVRYLRRERRGALYMRELFDSLVAEWNKSHSPDSPSQRLESCLLSSLDRVARHVAAQPIGRRFQLVVVSDLQEACGDWGGEIGINLEQGADELRAFYELDWTTDLSQIESVQIFLLPPAQGLVTGEQQRALRQAWMKHLVASGIDQQRIVFR